MEEKKTLKLNLTSAICIVIIILLIIGLIGLYLTYSKKIDTLNDDIVKLKGSNRKAITAEQFKSKIETKGFNVYSENNIQLNDIIKSGTKKYYGTVKNDDNSFKINFFEFDDTNFTKYEFYEVPAIIQYNNSNSEGNLIETSEDSLNYSKYTAINNGKYTIVSRIDNTICWGTSSTENKQIIDDIFTELGY